MKIGWLIVVAVLGALAACVGSVSADRAVSHRFPLHVDLSHGIAHGGDLWVFASRPWVPDPPTARPYEHVIYRFDSTAKLLGESALGDGALRAVDRQGTHGLALAVGVGEPGVTEGPSVLHLTHEGGATWAPEARLPSNAIGAAFLGGERIAVWWTYQAFVSEDLGKTWQQIRARNSRLEFRRLKVPAPAGAPPGVLLVNDAYDIGTGRNTSELGVLAPDGDFTVKVRLPGYLDSASLDREGRLWLAGYDGDVPATRVMTIEDLFGVPRVRVVREIPASLPGRIVVTDRTVILVYDEWRLDTVWPVHVEVVPRQGGQVGPEWRRVNHGHRPVNIFFDETSGLWLHTPFSNRLRHREWPSFVVR